MKINNVTASALASAMGVDAPKARLILDCLELCGHAARSGQRPHFKVEDGRVARSPGRPQIVYSVSVDRLASLISDGKVGDVERFGNTEQLRFEELSDIVTKADASAKAAAKAAAQNAKAEATTITE